MDIYEFLRSNEGRKFSRYMIAKEMKIGNRCVQDNLPRLTALRGITKITEDGVDYYMFKSGVE